MGKVALGILLALLAGAFVNFVLSYFGLGLTVKGCAAFGAALGMLVFLSRLQSTS
jgi:hypothetical protein